MIDTIDLHVLIVFTSMNVIATTGLFELNYLSCIMLLCCQFEVLLLQISDEAQYLYRTQRNVISVLVKGEEKQFPDRFLFLKNSELFIQFNIIKLF